MALPASRQRLPAALGARLVAGIEAIGGPRVRQVRSCSLMVGVELKERGTPTLRALQERGVLALLTRAAIS